MKVKNINSSSKKTEILIKDSLALHMKEKLELKNITVTELVEKAGITRAAFYTHYDNIYDLAKEIQEETLELLLEGAEDIHSLDDIYNYFDKVILHLKQNDEFYSKILASNEPLLFMDNLKDMFNNKLLSFSKDKNKRKELTIRFFTDGCVSLFVRHFRKEDNITLDEINEFMKYMFKKIFTD